ncbi:MAG: sulfur oxidation protein SoxA [uncultured Thiotrichaceae bacterium]|uniref:SoxAX cytochrome complex subunit A n=1 Tax=uncultured Thiotrichaceae bacterium TaxID=298394 RepID=A0A6S6UC39_9GAMM|nr:MAG: sulfur oxidation protein SoxA [uncultured Thiotrichaceae bacterium]
MKKLSVVLVTSALLLAVAGTTYATPEEDQATLKGLFMKKFKDVEESAYGDGAYVFREDAYEQFKEIEADFPPYEDQITEGEEMWNTAFANGKTYKDCLGEVDTVRAQYPKYDEENDTILTLEGQINACRTENGEKPLKWKKGPMASLSGYIADQAEGQKIDVKIPNEKAEEWYEKGKNFFYAKRGQLNMSCADCHVAYAGNRIRAEILSPAFGQVTHFPTYRAKWGQLGTLHRRYGGCNQQVRAKDFKAQSDEFKALEYFHTAMSNGLEWTGPAFRK